MKDNNKKLHYPLSKRPPDGETLEVAPDIYWLRMPLPIALNHINLWLLEGNEGWTIIDTGMATNESKTIWENLFEHSFKAKSLEKLVVTHMHLDHSGLAGWLADKWKIDPCFTEKEFLETLKISHGMDHKQREMSLDYYKKCGYDEESRQQFIERIEYRKSLATKLSNDFQHIKDQEVLQLSDGEWRIIVASGHSPEHACLYSETKNVFICGDILLPRITPNVSVNPTNPDSNPLGDWFDSLEKVKQSIPDDVLVLPSHGYPYQGAHKRIEAILRNHREKLEKIYSYTDDPKNVFELFPVLFESKINKHNQVLAVGETMSHLNYLVAENRLVRSIDENGLYLFSRN
tara:strand:+ start:4098 stop:5135 length:1038 start_codon:yes stop_codon:yes gene_type:complete